MAKTPEYAVNAGVILGDIHRAENRIDDAIAEYRAVLERQHLGANNDMARLAAV